MSKYLRFFCFICVGNFVCKNRVLGEMSLSTFRHVNYLYNLHRQQLSSPTSIMSYLKKTFSYGLHNLTQCSYDLADVFGSWHPRYN